MTKLSHVCPECGKEFEVQVIEVKGMTITGDPSWPDNAAPLVVPEGVIFPMYCSSKCRGGRYL